MPEVPVIRGWEALVFHDHDREAGLFHVQRSKFRGASKNLERMARATIIRPHEGLRREDTGTKYPTGGANESKR
jgi:hypothetical protein